MGTKHHRKDEVDDTMSDTTSNLDPLATWLHQHFNHEHNAEKHLLSECVNYVNKYTNASPEREALLSQSHAMIKKANNTSLPPVFLQR